MQKKQDNVSHFEVIVEWGFKKGGSKIWVRPRVTGVKSSSDPSHTGGQVHAEKKDNREDSNPGA